MKRKRQYQKYLQKRLSTIIELYLNQKGKVKQKKLKKLIEVKMREIIEFSENLSRKNKIAKKIKEQSTDDTASLSIQPSAALIETLHTTQKNIANSENATIIQ